MAISLFSQSGAGAAWRQMQDWHAKQKQYAADFEATNSGLLSALTDTFSSSSDGLFEITVRKALASAKERASARAKQNGLDVSI